MRENSPECLQLRDKDQSVGRRRPPGPPRLHHRYSSQVSSSLLFSSPCSPEFAVQLVQVFSFPETANPSPRAQSILRLSPRPGSLPGSNPHLASSYQVWTESLSLLLWELWAQDSPHTQAEEGQPPLGTEHCQAPPGATPGSLRAKP